MRTRPCNTMYSESPASPCWKMTSFSTTFTSLRRRAIFASSASASSPNRSIERSSSITRVDMVVQGLLTSAFAAESTEQATGGCLAARETHPALRCGFGLDGNQGSDHPFNGFAVRRATLTEHERLTAVG